jgi:hypothetical protein
MPFELEWRMWRQLRGAFEIDEFIFVGMAHDGYTFRQAPTMKDALAVLPGDCQRVFLEPSGYNSLYEMPKGDIALILGNTEQSNIHHAQVNETYRIASPGKSHLYPTDAAAIALALRYGQ